MAQLIALYGPAQLRVAEPFVTLASSIVSQQLSGKAAQTIWQRLNDHLSVTPQALFQAEALELRALGLSRAKADYLKDLARFALAGGLEDLSKLEDQEIIAHLVTIKGIGVWTAQMFLMFGLARPDVWPVLDLGLRKAAQRHYQAQTPKELQALGQRFSPYRSHATWYLWRSLDNR